MKPILVTVAVVVLLLDGGGNVIWAQASAEREVAQIVTQCQEALRQGDEKKVLSLLQDGLRRFPGNEELQVQTAALYAYQKHDDRAIALLKEVVKKNPASRSAKLELAQIYGYRSAYKESDELYRELLAAAPEDETAALGLVHNLILEGKRAEARRLAAQALQRHPTSLALRQYDDYLANSTGSESPRGRYGRAQVSESFLADSSGNRVLNSAQGLSYQFSRGLSSRLRMEETSLWRTNTQKLGVLAAADEVRLRVNKYIAARGSGGAVVYADTSRKWLASGDLDLFPLKNLTLSGGYSRYPVVPTYDATLLNLLSEGWHSRLDYNTRDFTLSGTFYLTHYSDGNRAERETAEALRWVHLFGNTFSIGAGYAFRHLHFAQELNHGYFSPSQYRSHLGGTGFRVGIGKHYRGELLGYIGEEIQNGGYTPAGEGLMRNDFVFGKWNLIADYSYFHLALPTGAFHANGGRASLAYTF